MKETKEVQKHNRPLWTQNKAFMLEVHKVVQGSHCDAESDAEDMIWLQVNDRYGVAPFTADENGEVLTWVFWPYAEPYASIVVDGNQLENVLSFLEAI